MNQLEEKESEEKMPENKEPEKKDIKKKKRTYNDIMNELLKPPPKEDTPNIHLSGGGQFSKLEKI